MTRAAPAVRLAALAALALLAAAAPAAAQGACGGAQPAPVPWAAPLDRPVTLRVRDVSLREALDRLSAAARVPLSYSSDLLPLDRRVCLDARRLPLGDALARVLAGTGVVPVLVAGQVVLAPGRGAREASPRAITGRVNVLDEVVVTGSAAGAPRRGLTVAMDAVDGRGLERRSASSLAGILNSAVPGVHTWRGSPVSLSAHYGSVRGASSFGATYPKVYVDGVEAANPLLVTEIDPDAVERVEVIRGPQGAALYGSEAISGVINIVTRHEGSGAGTWAAELRTRAGVAGSDFAPGPAGTHHQRVSVRTGTNLRSGGIALAYAGTGEIFPGASSRRVSGVADGRWVASSAILTATARFTGFRAGVGDNPLLAALPVDTARADEEPRQAARLYTLSGAANLAGQGGWTHTLLAGVDGYRLDYVPNDTGPILVGSEAALLRARGGADRATLRASTTRRLGGEGHAAGTVTLAAEHSVLRQATERSPRPGMAPAPQQQQQPGGPRPPTGGPPSPGDATVVQWLSNTGLLAQAGGAWRDTWFVTGGLRLERNDALENGSVAVLPMLGAAWVGGLGGAAELKLRAAYGRGIRAPRTLAREHQRTREWNVSPALEPESQSGVEVGAELYLGDAFRVQATRFDQRATGLAQDVVVGVDTVQHRGKPVERPRYELQNVGAIDNRGWEMQARFERGPLAVGTALTLVDSRVRRVAKFYTGDLRPGDRMLSVPARTAGLTAEWNAGTWTAALSAERAWDWINYDRLALAQAWAADEGAARETLAGERLRGFWHGYDGETDVSAAVTLQVRSGLRLLLMGENLLGSQLGEPDNVTIRAGRTLTFGVHASF